MRKIREVLRLDNSGASSRKIGQSCRLSPATVQGYLARAKAAKLQWPLPDEMSDSALEQLLFPAPLGGPQRKCPEPDYALLHLELKKKHVTKLLLWMEYREQHPDGYQYSQFCERYREWEADLDVTMRQTHRAGEKLFVDFSGDGINIVEPLTGECRTAKLFVAVLGASNMTYIEPVLGEDLPTWIGCHVRAFVFFGGVSQIVVPDNLKSGVTRPDFYDPEINRTYADLAEHYGVAIIPARKRKPRDKAKVEQAVLMAERWVLAVLRHREFTSLTELKAAVKTQNESLNDRPMKKIGRSRREVFEAIEKDALSPLPAAEYQICIWKKATVNIDYHVEFENNYYSVHYTHYTKRTRQVEIRATATSVEMFFGGRRIASHVRSYKKHTHTTLKEHMPAAHQRYLEWSPSRIVNWAKTIGPCTTQVIEKILESKPHPEQGFRSCLGVMRLKDKYPTERIERACEMALQFGTLSRRGIETILKNNRDRVPVGDGTTEQPGLPLHENVRGANYYH